MSQSDEELGRELLAQSMRESQLAISDDERDHWTLDNRVEEAVKQRFDLLVGELAQVVQKHVEQSVQHIVEDQLGALRASVLSILENEYTLVKK